MQIISENTKRNELAVGHVPGATGSLLPHSTWVEISVGYELAGVFPTICAVVKLQVILTLRN